MTCALFDCYSLLRVFYVLLVACRVLIVCCFCTLCAVRCLLFRMFDVFVFFFSFFCCLSCRRFVVSLFVVGR